MVCSPLLTKNIGITAICISGASHFPASPLCSLPWSCCCGCYCTGALLPMHADL